MLTAWTIREPCRRQGWLQSGYITKEEHRESSDGFADRWEARNHGQDGSLVFDLSIRVTVCVHLPR